MRAACGRQRCLSGGRFLSDHYFEQPTAGQHGVGDITRLLRDVRDGDRNAFDRVFARVYGELRRLARSQLRREREDHTLCTTALVHEAYLRLAGQCELDWGGRAHFFGIAARAMRQVLIDYARRRQAGKRGGNCEYTTLGHVHAPVRIHPEEVLALNEALERLDSIDQRLRKVVEYRFFCGLGPEEIAELLGVSERSVQRDWIKARAWLYRELYPDEACEANAAPG